MAKDTKESYLSLGNLYHELCHRHVHASREKNVAKELREAATEEDRTIMELAQLPDDYDFDRAFVSLFEWCQRAFERVEHLETCCEEGGQKP